MSIRLLFVFASMSPPIFVQNATEPDIIYFSGYEQKSATIESAIPDALDAIVKNAANDVFPIPATTDDRRIRSEAIRQARLRATEFVSYVVVAGPKSRVGAPGFVILNANVRRSDLMRIYDECARSLVGAPDFKIMLILDEREETPGNAALPFDDGKCTAAISDRLLQAGYRVVNGRQFERLRSIKGDFARLNGEDQRIVLQIAAEQGADIIVYGTVTARGPRVKDMHGQRFYFWNVDGTMHAVWRDTAIELFSIPLPDGDRDGAGRAAPRAGAAHALEKAGATFATEFLARMQALPPRTEIQLELQNCRKTSQLRQICAWLNSDPSVRLVSPTFAQPGVAKIVVRTVPNPRVFDLATHLEEQAEGANLQFTIEVREWGPNSILANVVPN